MRGMEGGITDANVIIIPRNFSDRKISRNITDAQSMMSCWYELMPMDSLLGLLCGISMTII